MIAQLVDGIVATFSPARGVARAHARRIARGNLARGYAGAESHRLNAQKRPKNQSADTELQGPYGADALRAWARTLVRDNAWAWSALDSIVSETIGSGIGVQSMLETTAGEDEEDTNDQRDKVWAEWCEVCDINGELTYNEIQTLAFREMVEAGECLIHWVTVPKKYKGIYRPVPLAMELIEADRLATEKDTNSLRDKGFRVVRGIEMDEDGTVLAYWVHPAHPSNSYALDRTPKRIDAKDITHLFRKDRIGQTRGVTWYAPVIAWMRDLGVYVDNEIQASAVASCFVAAIKTDSPLTGLQPPSTVTDTVDADGNQYEYLQPGLVMNLRPGESLESANPGRPNSNAGPWISLMQRGIAAGTGTSYEAISKDFSQTSYSSSRTSKIENRPRFRRWQNYWMSHFNQQSWDRFCDAAAVANVKAFPSMSELLDDRRAVAPVQFFPPIWEWVDISAEQSSSEAAIAALQTTHAAEAGARGANWRGNFYQAAKEKKLKEQLGLVTPTDAMNQQQVGTGKQAEAQAVAAVAGGGSEQPTSSLEGDRKLSLTEALQKIYLSVGKVITTEEARQIISQQYGVELLPGNAPTGEDGTATVDQVAEAEKPVATGEMAGLSTMQFNRNRKAIGKILDELASGETSEAKARVFLGSIGMAQASIDILIADALDGSVDELPASTEPEPEPKPETTERTAKRDKNGIRML